MTILPREIALDYCNTLLAHFRGTLSDWERDFVTSVRVQIQSNPMLIPTEKQSCKLDKIMERVARGYDGSKRDA